VTNAMYLNYLQNKFPNYKPSKEILALAEKIKVLGILNLSPDSFSDGNSQYLDPEYGLVRTKQLQRLGVDIIDLGGQSTRPGAGSISDEEEWLRLESFFKNYDIDLPLSLDSYKPNIIEQALKASSQLAYINDVTGLQNPELLKVLANHGYDSLHYIAMHSKGGIPPSLKSSEITDDFYKEDGGLLEHMKRFFDQSLKLCQSFALDTKKIILDPGFGFGKNFQQSMFMLSLIPQLKREFALPILLGASRKSFLKLWPEKITELKLNPELKNPELDILSREFNNIALEHVDLLRLHG